jgi:hypothetical protein
MDGHHITLLTAYLLQTKKILPQSHPEIIFQGILSFLANFDYHNKVIDFSTDELVSRESNAALPFPVNFLHPISQSGSSSSSNPSYNVFWRISYSMMSHLQLECHKSLKNLQIHQNQMLNHNKSRSRSAATALSSSSYNSNLNIFESLFLEKRSFFEEYDYFFHIKIDSSWKSYLLSDFSSVAETSSDNLKESSLHFPVYLYFSERCRYLLEKSLGDRIAIGNCFIRSSHSLKINEKLTNHSFLNLASSSSQSSSQDNHDYHYIISFGMILNKQNYQRKVEKGLNSFNGDETNQDPFADHSSSATSSNISLNEFKEFWGDKCELRRFRDGTIVESVVFDGKVFPHNHYSILEEVSRYILTYHLPLQSNEITSVSTLYQLSNHISFQNQIRLENNNNFSLSDNNLNTIIPTTMKSRQQQYLSIIEIFDELKSLLINQIKNIPLSIDNLLPISSELRQTSFIIPLKHPFIEYQFIEENLQKKSFYYEIIQNKFLKEFNGKIIPSSITPLLIICEFESSNKWPKDPIAIQSCKNAFLLKIKYELKNQFSIESIIHENTLDILMKGYLFRLIPFASIENEKILLLNDQKSLSSKEEEDNDNENYGEGMKGIQRLGDYIVPLANRLWLLPSSHHNAIKAIQLEFPVFGESVQFLSFWLAKNCLSGKCNRYLQ